MKKTDKYLDQVIEEIDALRKILEGFPREEAVKLVRMAEIITGAISQGKTIFTCGNGGSAADAQHIVGELVGRFRRKKIKGFKAFSLTANPSVTTAMANDYAYSEVFSRQLDSVGNEGDVLLSLSTSGDSPNIIQAVEKAEELGMISLVFTGKSGGKVAEISHIAFRVSHHDTPRIQEVHMTAGHILCGLVEEMVVNGE
ncbi:MAG: SIS domain-containing protein [Candidatus Krumholzibacteriota bacterium]|nr:SIS domain-containing protein [Candidatus Krumholzibacteriota bacterium]